MNWMHILSWVLTAQLIYSSSATFAVTVQRERLASRRRKLGAALWGTSYVTKSALIAMAILWAPEKNHWVVLYALLGMAIFGIGDAGLLLLWSEERSPKGEA